MNKKGRVLAFAIFFAVLIFGILAVASIPGTITGFASKKKDSDSGSTDSSKSSKDVEDIQATSTESKKEQGSDKSTQSSDETTTDSGEDNVGGGTGRKVIEEESYTFLDDSGKEFEVTVRTETKEDDGEISQKIKVRGVEINSDVQVEQEGNSLNAKLSNGAKSEVKIMPDTASQTAIEKLQTKGLDVQLKEVGEGNDLSVVYEAEGNKSVKFLGLFKVRTEIKAVISAENGEILRLEKPWWYFLAFKEGVVDCDENNLDLCDDELECAEAGLIWFDNSCLAECPGDTFTCDDNETIILRDRYLNCEFDIDTCPILEQPSNETENNQTIIMNETF